MPAAKKSTYKPNPALVKLLEDTKQLTKEQKALDRKIKALNKRYLKADSAKDRRTARKIETASTELNILNDKADLFSAEASGDPWEYVENTMQRAVDEFNAENYTESEDLALSLGYREDITETTVREWKELRQFKDTGYGRPRQERYIAELQLQFIDIFEHLNIEQPYPDARLDW